MKERNIEFWDSLLQPRYRKKTQFDDTRQIKKKTGKWKVDPGSSWTIRNSNSALFLFSKFLARDREPLFYIRRRFSKKVTDILRSFFVYVGSFLRTPDGKKSRPRGLCSAWDRKRDVQLKTSHGFSKGRLKWSYGLLRNTLRLMPKDIIYRWTRFLRAGMARFRAICQKIDRQTSPDGLSSLHESLPSYLIASNF